LGAERLAARPRGAAGAGPRAGRLARHRTGKHQPEAAEALTSREAQIDSPVFVSLHRVVHQPAGWVTPCNGVIAAK